MSRVDDAFLCYNMPIDNATLKTEENFSEFAFGVTPILYFNFYLRIK